MNEITNNKLFEQIKNLIEQTKNNVATVSQQLHDNFGKSFDEKNLQRIIQFANVIEKQKVVTVSRELS